MEIKLIQLDGDLPNLALMKLAHYFRNKGANIHFTRSVRRDLFEPEYTHVFASQIFTPTKKKADLLRDYYPNAVIGGTGVSVDPNDTIENFLNIPPDYKHLDYSIYPEFEFSIGMTQLGCTSKCPFCCVPQKEGFNRPVSNISEIYRGAPWPKKLILLDNDFQSRRGWEIICQEIIDGDFEVSFIQGINVRKLTRHHVPYFKQIKFKDKVFKKKRFYCAWDKEDDRKQVERGFNLLAEAGITGSTISVYFLCNYWQRGLTEDIWNRFLFMINLGLRPYAMVFEKWKLPPGDDLKVFQNWVNTHNCYVKPTKEGFYEYKNYYQNYKHKKIEEVQSAELLGF